LWRTLTQASRTNFTLERELVETDERIKLHVKNRSNISSETTGKAKLEEEKVPEEDSGIVVGRTEMFCSSENN